MNNKPDNPMPTPQTACNESSSSLEPGAPRPAQKSSESEFREDNGLSKSALELQCILEMFRLKEPKDK